MTFPTENVDFVVNRSSLGECRFVSSSVCAIEEGDVRFLSFPAFICNPSLHNYNWTNDDGRPFWKHLSKLPALFDDCLTPFDGDHDPVEVKNRFDEFKDSPM